MTRAREHHGHFGWLTEGREGYHCVSCMEEAEDVFDLDSNGNCAQCVEDLRDSEHYYGEVLEQYRFGQSGR